MWIYSLKQVQEFMHGVFRTTVRKLVGVAPRLLPFLGEGEIPLLREHFPLPSLPRWLARRDVPMCVGGRSAAPGPHAPTLFSSTREKTQVIKPVFSSPHPDSGCKPRSTFIILSCDIFIFSTSNNFELIEIHALCEIWVSTVGSVARRITLLNYHRPLTGLLLVIAPRQQRRRPWCGAAERRGGRDDDRGVSMARRLWATSLLRELLATPRGATRVEWEWADRKQSAD